LRKKIVSISLLILCLSLFAGCGLLVTEYYLTVGIEGKGSVNYDPPQEEKYPDGTEVTLTAVPDKNWCFSHWKGDIESTEAEIVIKMDEDKNLTAVFERMDFELNIDTIGEGVVEVVEVIEPASLEYPYETRVKLEAVPEDGWDFKEWEGDLTGTDPEAEIKMDEDKNITAVFQGLSTVAGYVTDTRGGPGVEGAVVKGMGLEATTDAQGFFELKVGAGYEFDLIIEKEGRAPARAQDIFLEEGEVLEIEIPTRGVLNPEWPMDPPFIKVDGVERGGTVSGEITVNIEIESENDIFVHYVYFGGLQRAPRENEIEIGAETSEVVIDTTKHPNGESYLRVLAYDRNEQAALLIIPVVVDNEKVHAEVPGEIPYLQMYSVTSGINIGYYAEGRAEFFEKAGIEKDPYIIETRKGDIIDLQSLEEGYSLYTHIEWDPAPDADGYAVYRSFDGEDYTHIGNVVALFYDDYSHSLKTGQETYYKVVPYNSYGEGEPFERSVTPLPSYNVFLEEPANEGTGVDLQPTFKWDIKVDGEFCEEVLVDFDIWLWEATWSWVWFEEQLEAKEATVPFLLEPGAVYSWDIFYSEAFLLYEFGTDGFSYALSIAGDGFDFGSLNGEYIFTTTTEVE